MMIIELLTFVYTWLRNKIIRRGVHFKPMQVGEICLLTRSGFSYKENNDKNLH